MEIDQHAPSKDSVHYQNHHSEIFEDIHRFEIEPHELNSPVEVIKEQSKLDPVNKRVQNFYQCSTDYTSDRHPDDQSITPFRDDQFDEILGSHDTYPTRKPYQLNIAEI